MVMSFAGFAANYMIVQQRILSIDYRYLTIKQQLKETIVSFYLLRKRTHLIVNSDTCFICFIF